MSSGFTFITTEGALCPLCFEWHYLKDLYVDEEGQMWDICKSCKQGEK